LSTEHKGNKLIHDIEYKLKKNKIYFIKDTVLIKLTKEQEEQLERNRRASYNL
jgi:hypothetical protein